MSSAWRQLRLAVHVLAGPDLPRERLLRCYTSHLADLRPKDMPMEIRAGFLSLLLRLDRDQERNAGNVRQALEAIPDIDIMLMIHSIIDMYDAVTRYQPLPRTGDDGSHKSPPATRAASSNAIIAGAR